MMAGEKRNLKATCFAGKETKRVLVVGTTSETTVQAFAQQALARLKLKDQIGEVRVAKCIVGDDDSIWEACGGSEDEIEVFFSPETKAAKTPVKSVYEQGGHHVQNATGNIFHNGGKIVQNETVNSSKHIQSDTVKIGNVSAGAGGDISVIGIGKGTVNVDQSEKISDGNPLDKLAESEKKKMMRSYQENACMDGRPAYLPVGFLDEMAAACRSVCALSSTANGGIYGTGFLLEGGWIMTNMHNVCVTYRSENDQWKNAKTWKRNFAKEEATFKRETECVFLKDTPASAGVNVKFSLNAEMHCFPHLDVALVKIEVGNAFLQRGEPKPKALRVIPAPHQVSKNERCFVVGHPVFWHHGKYQRAQDYKMISMQRENTFMEAMDKDGLGFCRYFTDTEPGNSGSPVLVWDSKENAIYVAAIHHTGILLEVLFKATVKVCF